MADLARLLTAPGLPWVRTTTIEDEATTSN
jgi:hypothetical protein